MLANVTCVAISGRAVLIEGAPGSGKSSLALALIDRGAVLVGDDGVTLEDRESRLWAAPPPNIAGLIEVRNLGLVQVPRSSAPLALVVRLDPAAPRFIDHAAEATLEGHALPAVALWPDTPALALRVEYALKTYGLGSPLPFRRPNAQENPMASESPTDRQRILLVTGMLGAGKTTALHELEDIGWEAVDNFPIRLLGRLIGEGERADGEAAALAIGFDSRTRGFAPERVIERVKQLSARADLEVSTLFLDCSTAELQRRFDETRRRHHLAQDVPVDLGILAERELLAPLRRWADVLIDTTRFSSNELRQVIRQHFADQASGHMTVTISSFGFARGVPPAADLVFDMRFLDNPHWQPELRELTGLDKPVGEHIAKDQAFEPNLERIRDLLIDLLPRYAAQGRTYVNIAFGCTGGRHRSVFMAEKVAAALRAGGFSPTVLHRNLGSRAAGMIEGSHQP